MTNPLPENSPEINTENLETVSEVTLFPNPAKNIITTSFIFADSKFLLKGLNYLLEYNKH